MLDPIEISPATQPQLYRIIRLSAGARQQVVFRLMDDTGAPVDLQNEPAPVAVPPPEFSGQPMLAPANAKVLLKVRRSRDMLATEMLELTGKIRQGTDGCQGCTGVVEFELLDSATTKPGVYLADVGLFSADTYLIRTWPCYLVFEKTAFTTDDPRHCDGPITVPEIRMALMDVPGLEVSLLDSTEFKDTDILAAMRRPVDLWNETPPPVERFTVNTFPYRYWWTEATVAILLDMAAAGYRRNHLAYSAGGISIDDQNKFNQSQQMSAEKMREFREWMKTEKIRLNARRAWRSFGV